MYLMISLDYLILINYYFCKETRYYATCIIVNALIKFAIKNVIIARVCSLFVYGIPSPIQQLEINYVV